MNKVLHTFSIVAYDPKRQEWGVAVQSKFLAVGAVVPWARGNAGAVATQSYADLTYGVKGLDLMETGLSADEAIQILIKDDEEKDLRQIGLVDRQGNASAFTGEKCHEWAGQIVGEGFSCQGNLLLPGTVEAMALKFEEIRGGEGELADWLVLALEAGQEAGGDRRGRQSASVLVVREEGGYGGNNDRYLDLRVDDHPYPILKLHQLVENHHLYFGEVDPDNILPMDSTILELQNIMIKSGHLKSKPSGLVDEHSLTALRTLVGEENLEERWNGDQKAIDGKVVEFLRNKFGD